MVIRCQCSGALLVRAGSLLFCVKVLLLCSQTVLAEPQAHNSGSNLSYHGRRPQSGPTSRPDVVRVIRHRIDEEQPKLPPGASSPQHIPKAEPEEEVQAADTQVLLNLDQVQQGLAARKQVAQQQQVEKTNPFVTNRQPYVNNGWNVQQFLSQIRGKGRQHAAEMRQGTIPVQSSESNIPLLQEEQPAGYNEQRHDAQQAQQVRAKDVPDLEMQLEERWAALKAHREFITNATAPGILQRTANRKGQVILLVFQIDRERTALET